MNKFYVIVIYLQDNATFKLIAMFILAILTILCIYHYADYLFEPCRTYGYLDVTVPLCDLSRNIGRLKRKERNSLHIIFIRLKMIP